jgi:hypothetical protein
MSSIRPLSRRQFLESTAMGCSAAALGGTAGLLHAQSPGVRPGRVEGVTVENPRCRVPVGLIIDDSTCLVNLNRFAMPQFDTAWGGTNKVYQRDWKSWPVEIPDAFVRKFGEWCAAHGVKGKYSIVPYPACVGRLDREVPGWTRRGIEDSIRLVRDVMMPNWDIHPEMVTHTRVIDLKTGHPYPELSVKFMENWEWTTGRSADEIAAYMTYALGILKNIGLPHVPQKPRSAPSGVVNQDSARRSSEICTAEASNPTHVTNAAPWARWHRVQWQWATHFAGNGAEQLTAPHRQLPLACASVMLDLLRQAHWLVVHQRPLDRWATGRILGLHAPYPLPGFRSMARCGQGG